MSPGRLATTAQEYEIGPADVLNVIVGIAAACTERRSNVADFGVEDMLVGGTITFTP